MTERSLLIPVRTDAPILGMEDAGDDLFVTCAGAEDRTLAVVNRLHTTYRTQRAVVFACRDYREQGRSPEFEEAITRKLDDCCAGNVDMLVFDLQNPIPSFSKLWELISTIDGCKSISVDITSFPRQEALMLLHVLDSLASSPRVRLFYSEPQQFGTEQEGGWLTRGVLDVSSVPGFGGVQRPGKREVLVLFLGLEDERAAIVRSRLQPAATVYIFPEPGFRKALDGASTRIHRLLLSDTEQQTVLSSIPANGISQARDSVLDLHEQLKADFDIVVAPLGTKMQTLGVYEAARQRIAIQVVHALPAVYNFQGYSAGIGHTWEIPWRN